MRTSYKTLTSDEYNVLNLISNRTKDDCWFCLKQDKDGVDYVWDIESRRRLCLKTGVGCLAECLDYYDTYQNCRLNCFEDLTFRNLLKKLNIGFGVTYDGPSIIGMSKYEFVEYCKDNNVEYKVFSDDILVGDMIYQFGQDSKCFDFVALNLDKEMRLESRKGLDESISEAKKIGEEQTLKVIDRDSDDIIR